MWSRSYTSAAVTLLQEQMLCCSGNTAATGSDALIQGEYAGEIEGFCTNDPLLKSGA